MHYGAVGYLNHFAAVRCHAPSANGSSRYRAGSILSEDYLTRELEALAAHDAPAVFNVDAGLNLNAQAFRNLVAAEKKVGFLKKSWLVVRNLSVKNH